MVEHTEVEVEPDGGEWVTSCQIYVWRTSDAPKYGPDGEKGITSHQIFKSIDGTNVSPNRAPDGRE